jgi:hypothetical protein
LDDAARIGIPSNSTEAQKANQKLQCGYGASEKGSRFLADAQIKASEIKAAG